MDRHPVRAARWAHIRSLEMATCTMGSHGKLDQREADVHVENSFVAVLWLHGDKMEGTILVTGNTAWQDDSWLCLSLSVGLWACHLTSLCPCFHRPEMGLCSACFNGAPPCPDAALGGACHGERGGTGLAWGLHPNGEVRRGSRKPSGRAKCFVGN